MPPVKGTSLIVVLGLACGAGADAQFTQYTRPGSFQERPVSTKTLLDRAIEDAKWSTGRLYADPWLALRELTYDDNVGGRREGGESDVTATVGLGARAYMPIGEDLVLAGHLLPEYVWWRDLEERRRVNGRAGLGLFGTLGRTSLELSATHIDEARFFSREFEDQVNTRDDVGALSLDVALGRGVSLFGAGRLRRLRFLDEEPEIPPVRTLDRDETVARGGLRYAFRGGLAMRLGVEYSEAEFEALGSIRNNSGSSPLLGIEYEGRELYLESEVVARDLEFEDAPEPLGFDEATGFARLTWFAFDRLALQLYTRRDLVYSFTDRWAYFEDQVHGAALVASFGPWARARLFGESGSNDYQVITQQFEPREDDLDGYGLGLELDIAGARATLRLEVSRTDYASSLPEFDREVTVIRSGLIFGRRTLSPWA